MVTKLTEVMKASEFLVVMLAIIGVAWHIGLKYEDNQRAKLIAGQTLAVVQQQLKTQVDENKKLTGQLVDQQAEYLKLAAQIRAQNAEIDAEMSAKNAQLQTQQKSDSTLPIAGLASRWQKIEDLTPIDVTVEGGHLSISGPGSLKTVEDLESVTPLHDEVMSEHQVEDNLTSQLTSLGALSASQNEQITGLDSQLTLAAKNCQDQIVLVKQQQKKRSGFWFKVGGVAGVVLTALILK
jgi:hypothetical protein